MSVSLDDMKLYLRVDSEDEDDLVAGLITSAECLCRDILRLEDGADLDDYPNTEAAVMYAAAFMYEHREEADYAGLLLTLRSILSGAREPAF